MNLKLLEKLVKLANNNPNEHEANAAARRACRLISDGQFKFVEDKAQSPIKHYAYYEETANVDSQAMRDFFKRYTQKEAQKNNNWDNPFKEGNYEPVFKDFKRDRKVRKGPERNLKCKTCGQIINTIFQGLPELFECNGCQWTAYERNKKG